MAWDTEFTTVLRVMIADYTVPYTNTDASLKQVLIVSAQTVLTELTFTYAYITDINNQTILPDPTDNASRDNSFINLTTLKAACIIDRGAAGIAAKGALIVRDNGSFVDFTGKSRSLTALLDKGWCAAYTEAKFQYQSGLGGVAGHGILTPFRVFAGYSDYGQNAGLGRFPNGFFQ